MQCFLVWSVNSEQILLPVCIYIPPEITKYNLKIDVALTAYIILFSLYFIVMRQKKIQYIQTEKNVLLFTIIYLIQFVTSIQNKMPNTKTLHSMQNIFSDFVYLF